jgi:hypothetical protein
MTTRPGPEQALAGLDAALEAARARGQDLVTLTEYKSGNFPDHNPDSVDWPRDADPCLLHHWVADRLGCWRVTLEEGTARIWRPWPPRLPTREPVYYVRSAVPS